MIKWAWEALKHHQLQSEDFCQTLDRAANQLSRVPEFRYRNPRKYLILAWTPSITSSCRVHFISSCMERSLHNGMIPTYQ